MRDLPDYRALLRENEEMRRDFRALRSDVRFHLGALNSGYASFRGEANAYQRSFISKILWSRSMLIAILAIQAAEMLLIIWILALVI